MTLADDIAFLPITELSRRIDAGALDPVALTALYLDRIDRVGQELNAYLTVCRQEALEAAHRAANRAGDGERRGPLDGIPIALKDNIDVAGVPTTNGLGGSDHPVAAADAEVTRRLRDAGAVILGKLNMHEAAFGAVSDNPHHGVVHNPFRHGHTPGGSSGGSGAAIAAGLCAATLGSDTGGSIRIPAACCGVVGLKPTYGLVSTRGVVPLSHRLDHVGPLARTVEDAAIVLEAIAGFDASSVHARRAPDYSFVPEARADLSGIRLGLVRNFESESVEPDVARLFTGARRRLEQLGATFQTIEFAGYDPAIVRHALFLRIEAEAAAIHDALYREQPERFSPTVRGYLDYGRRMSAQKLLAADAILEAAAFAADLALEDVDALITPMMPQTAFAFASKTPANQTTYCPPANIGGLPAISVPMGVDAQGMPAGLQIVGARHAERRLLGIAALYERATSHHAHPPRPYGP